MMGELLKNAWTGWLDFMEAGKLGALLGLSLLLCFGLSLGKEKKREMLWYSCVMTVACILPPSAVLFMLYQTKFYDYEWIWILVPLTAMIACGEVLLLEWYWKESGKRGSKVLVLLGAILLLNFLSGSLGNPNWKVEDLNAQRTQAAQVLSAIKQDGGDICLWAPQEIVSQARSIDGDIRLLYGRNLYQAHLNAYSYETYPDDMKYLYAWMVMAGRYGSVVVPVEGDVAAQVDGLEIGDSLDGITLAKRALELGANRILLPGNMSQDAVGVLTRELSLRDVRVGEYILLTPF